MKSYIAARRRGWTWGGGGLRAARSRFAVDLRTRVCLLHLSENAAKTKNRPKKDVLVITYVKAGTSTSTPSSIEWNVCVCVCFTGAASGRRDSRKVAAGVRARVRALDKANDKLDGIKSG